jgi:uncharacterized PurR-regulated membrane protein YhhQ (DUF165 family)
VRGLGVVAWLAFVATVFVANWLVQTYGVVQVGFGLVAPAAVFAAGFAFTFRDLVHRLLGRKWTVAAIIVGALASALVSPRFAFASGVAFVVSELADLTVYEPVARRSWTFGVLASNVVGLVIDSLLFLWLAFGSLAFLPGQLVGKAWTTLVAVAVIVAVRGTRALLPRHA